MIRRRAQPGFTLLEVVLAVTLSLALMAAILTFYRQAAHVREAVLDEARLVAAERLVMSRVTEELRGALVYPFVGLGLDGGIDQMRFSSAVLPGPAAWVVTKMTDQAPPPPERDVQIVGYRLRIVEDEMGQPVIEGLERTCQRVLTARVTEEGQNIEATLLSDGIKFLRLRYWDGNAWVDSWGGGDLPGAVEIALGQEPLPEGVDPLQYPYPTFRRVIYVPEGAKATGGTVVRGLGGEGEP